MAFLVHSAKKIILVWFWGAMVPPAPLDPPLRSAYGMNRPSVCSLSVCDTLLHPRQRLELFGNIFAPPNSSGIGQLVLKF